ncbi:MAG: hypothetical protein ACI9XO_001761 [Paraglaciecola sp.]|jgi:hypothetical protein
MILQKGYIFNWVEFNFDLPFKIADDIYLRKANEDEMIFFFREHCLRNSDENKVLNGAPIYELEYKRAPQGFSPRAIEPSQWKYWVIESYGSNYLGTRNK